MNQKEAEKKYQFELRQQKRKEKHKGRYLPFSYCIGNFSKLSI
ncbi:YjdF family protein [Variimorphobacter saccharofermentans]|nr:YjdF family protein [Variimorphobacter saccharofermentans]